MKSAADAENFNKLVLGDVPPITADELKKVMKTFNDSATYADLKALALDASDLAKIAARRK